MVLFLREHEIESLLTMPAVMDAVEAAMREHGLGQATNQARRRSPVGKVLLQVMSAAVPGIGRLGLKAYTTGPRGARFWVMLWNEEGDLLALMEADKLGQMRTGAATGVATRHLARPDSRTAALLGAGWQARSQLLAVATALPELQEVRVWSRTPARAEAFCAEMAAQVRCRLVPVASAEAAVRGADVVVTGTSAREPVLRGLWLAPGMHLNLIGSNRAHAREADTEAITRCDVVVVDSVEQARIESGDLLPVVAAGQLDWSGVHELGAVIAGAAPGRTAPEQITLFKSHGLALWDVATAHLAYQLARERGLGLELPI